MNPGLKDNVLQSLLSLDQLQRSVAADPYARERQTTIRSCAVARFPVDSVFTLRMQSMTAGSREQPRAHAVLCGEERENVEKGSAGTRRAF
jgi:hypothetical protein